MREEFERLGYKIPIRLVNDFASDELITLREGVVFNTYKPLVAKTNTENGGSTKLQIGLEPKVC